MQTSLKWSGRAGFIAVFLAFCMLYQPLLSKTLLSDDFDVVLRLSEGNFFIPGFFRPMSDLSIMADFELWGINGGGYLITSILFHFANAFLLFQVVLRLDWLGRDRRFIAFASAALFLIYPFHNESIVWAVGRGSLLATFFALSSLLVASSSAKSPLRVVVSSLLFFAGLAAYESILLLPVILLLLIPRVRGNELAFVLLGGLSAILANILLRVWLAPPVIGNYGLQGFWKGAGDIMVSGVKFAGRLFLPPDLNAWMFLGLSLVFLVFLVFVLTRFPQAPTVRLLLSVLLAGWLPAFLSVSTQTSEADRLLYFPSCFWCLLLAYFISFVSQPLTRFAILSVLLGYHAWQTKINNDHWVMASAITKATFTMVRSIPNDKTVMLVNLPSTYNGAFVFRNGFLSALELQKMNVERFYVEKKLSWPEQRERKSRIRHQTRVDSILIPPTTVVEIDRRYDYIMYWDTEKWICIDPVKEMSL